MLARPPGWEATHSHRFLDTRWSQDGLFLARPGQCLTRKAQLPGTSHHSGTHCSIKGLSYGPLDPLGHKAGGWWRCFLESPCTLSFLGLGGKSANSLCSARAEPRKQLFLGCVCSRIAGQQGLLTLIVVTPTCLLPDHSCSTRGRALPRGGWA